MKNKEYVVKIALVLLAFSASAFTCGGEDPVGAPPAPPPPPSKPMLGKVSVAFLAPRDHTEITGDTIFELSAEGVTIAPATELELGKGYFVLSLDGGCTRVNEQIPEDERHVHLKGGESAVSLSLPEGMRYLCLQVAYGDGRAYEGFTRLTVYVY